MIRRVWKHIEQVGIGVTICSPEHPDALRQLAAALDADPAVDWAEARAAVVRSTWDYHHHRERFLEWADRAGALTRLFNLPESLRWNSHKGYLADLEANGVPVVPTVWLAAGSEASLSEIMASQGWAQAVVKPAVSASRRA